MKAWVQRDGQKREDTGVLGWDAALEMYRPLLSYDELGHILEGRPSDFYDQLYKLLGLEQLTEAIARLDDEVKRLKQPATELRKAREALKPVLEDHDDPRAATALAQVKKTKPNLDAVRPLITQAAASTVPPAWPAGRPADRTDQRRGRRQVHRAATGRTVRARGNAALRRARRRPRQVAGTWPDLPRAARHAAVSGLWPGHSRRQLGRCGPCGPGTGAERSAGFDRRSGRYPASPIGAGGCRAGGRAAATRRSRADHGRGGPGGLRKVLEAADR